MGSQTCRQTSESNLKAGWSIFQHQVLQKHPVWTPAEHLTLASRMHAQWVPAPATGCHSLVMLTCGRFVMFWVTAKLKHLGRLIILEWGSAYWVHDRVCAHWHERTHVFRVNWVDHRRCRFKCQRDGYTHACLTWFKLVSQRTMTGSETPVPRHSALII